MARYLASSLVADNPCQKIRQAVYRQKNPSIGNPASTNNVAHRKRWGGRRDHRAIQIAKPGNPSPPIVTVDDLNRNLETLSCPRFKVGASKFGEVALQELLAISRNVDHRSRGTMPRRKKFRLDQGRGGRYRCLTYPCYFFMLTSCEAEVSIVLSSSTTLFTILLI
jgi:hypothetical protein